MLSLRLYSSKLRVYGLYCRTPHHSHPPIDSFGHPWVTYPNCVALVEIWKDCLHCGNSIYRMPCIIERHSISVPNSIKRDYVFAYGGKRNELRAKLPVYKQNWVKQWVTKSPWWTRVTGYLSLPSVELDALVGLRFYCLLISVCRCSE